MKEDMFMQEALGHLDPELLEESEKVMAKKRRPAPMRALMAAACICALLVVGAVAAEVAGFDFVHIFGEQEEESVCYVIIRGDDGATELEERNQLYVVRGSGAMKNVPLSELSPALQELQEQYKNEDWYSERLIFDSWEEAEEYIGREISDNVVLDQAKYSLTYLGMSEQDRKGNCIVSAGVKYGELSSVDVSARYYLTLPDAGENTVDVNASVCADFFIGDELPMCPDHGFMDNGYWTVEGQESYLTANGLEAVIINVKEVRDGESLQDGAYHAFFFLRGVRFMVEVNYWDGIEDIILTGLKQVLDGFQ